MPPGEPRPSLRPRPGVPLRDMAPVLLPTHLATWLTLTASACEVNAGAPVACGARWAARRWTVAGFGPLYAAEADGVGSGVSGFGAATRAGPRQVLAGSHGQRRATLPPTHGVQR